MSAVVYTRVPQALKQALAARARARGLSENALALELLEQGLAVGDDTQAGAPLERELAAATHELAQTQARLAEAEQRLQAATVREQTLAQLLWALAERARQPLAGCPRCRTPLRGRDYLLAGHCPSCGQPLTALLAPRPQTGAPDRDAYLPLLGALGGLLGLALATDNNNAG